MDDGYLFSIFLYSEHKETDRQCKALVQSWHFHFKNRVIQRFLRTSVGAAFNASDITNLTDDVSEIGALAFGPGFIPWPAPPGIVADNNYYHDDTTDYRRIKNKKKNSNSQVCNENQKFFVFLLVLGITNITNKKTT